MRVMYIDRVAPCQCADHGSVVLRSADGFVEHAVKTEIGAARAIASQLQGIPAEAATYLETLRVSVEACGGRLEGVVLALRGDHAHSAHLCINRAEDSVRIRVPAAIALTAVAHLGLELWCREEAPQQAAMVPEVFQRAFDAADGGESQGRG